MPITEGAVGLYTYAGVPGAGTNATQTITINPDDSTGGTFKLRFEGFVTPDLADDVSSANVQVALRALPSINGANVTVTGDGPHTVTFIADRGKQAEALIESVDEDGVAVVIAHGTPGVDATFRGAAKGSIVTDTTNGKLYIQTSGTVNQPTWTLVGSQT